MKSFAQLKRDLLPGVTVKTVLNTLKPEKTGEIRVIGANQSNAIAFETKDGRLSWLWWPKATEIEYENRTFKVFDPPASYNNNTRTLLFIYEIL